MTKFLKLLLVSLLLLQLFAAGSFELAHDEAYYWLFSRHLDWGYFDHPPFVALVIRAFSFLPHSEFAVRCGFVLLQFLALAALFPLIEPKARTRAALLFFAFPLASLSGLLALPDMPLLFMTAVYCLSLKRFLERRDLSSSFLLALVIALLFYAKYHGILLVFFTVLALPGLLREKKFYLIAGVSILLFLPHAWWQYTHDFATLRYHFIERPKSSFSLARSFEYLGIQLALAGALAGPLVWWAALKDKRKDDFSRAMRFAVIGTVVFFLLSSFSKRVEANWTVFLAVPLIYLAAPSSLWDRKWAKALLYVSFSIVMAVRLAAVLPPGTVPVKRLKEVHGWEDWAKEMKQKCRGTLMANTYQLASKLSFYLQEEVHALNLRSRKNHFDYWRFDQKRPMDQVCYITDKSGFEGESIQTPEGKALKMVTNVSLPELLALKEKQQ